MSYLGSWKIDDLLTFPVITTRFDTGAATDADSVPTYRVYEDETSTAILTGSMALLDSSNTAGFYSEQITLSAANGFEKGKCYTIYIQATINSVIGATHHTFQMEAEVDANRVNWANVDGPTTTVNLSGTSVKTATDVEADTQDIQNRIPAALDANGYIKADVRDFNGTAGTFASGRPEVNTTHWKGTAAATVDTAGYPVVTIKDGIGQGEIGTTAGAIDSVTVTSLSSIVIASLRSLFGISSATANGSTTTLIDGNQTGYGNDEFANCFIMFLSYGLVRTITDYDDATGTFTFAPALPGYASTLSGDNYEILPHGFVNEINTGAINADAIATDAIGANEFSQAAADKVWSTASRTLTAFGFSVTVSTNSDKTGYSLSTAGVQAIWDALTAALTTAGSIGKLLVDNVNATISSRATQTSVDTVAGYIDTEIATLLSRIGAFTGTGVNTILGFLKAIASKAASTPSDVGGTFDASTDSIEAIRDRGDAAWTGGGGSGSSLLPDTFGGEWELAQANRICFFLQDTNGDAVAGLGSGFTLQLSKNAGAFAGSGGTKAEIGTGWYTYLSTAGEADTVGPIAIKITGTGAIQRNFEFVVKQRNPAAIAFTYTVTVSGGIPVEGFDVWITTDLAGTNTIWAGRSDTLGVARRDGALPYLDPGTYHFWGQKVGYDPFGPDTEVVS